MAFLVHDINENKQNIEEHVQPNIENDNGINMIDDFEMDDLNPEDIEALDAAEEQTLKADIKASINVVKDGPTNICTNYCTAPLS